MAVCTLSVLLGLQGVIQGSRSPNNHVSALFNALSRPVWALGVAWLLFACVHGYGGMTCLLLIFFIACNQVLLDKWFVSGGSRF